MSQPHLDENSLNTQLFKEAKWAFYMSLFYLFGWVLFGYFSPTGRGFFGFPLWFEASCFYLPMMFIFVSYVVLKSIYKENISLDQPLDDSTENPPKAPNEHKAGVRL